MITVVHRLVLVSLLATGSCLWSPATAQSNWQRQQQWQRQNDMHRQQEMQRQQQIRQQQEAQRRQMQEQQRQQMQAEQRRQMQEQQRQQMQAQQRQQLQTQQRQQLQNQQKQTTAQQRQQMQRQGTLGKDGKPTGVVVSGGTARLTRPLTPAEIQRGFTGRVTADGRALIKYENRIFAVPASRVAGLSARLAKQSASRQAGSTQSTETSRRLALVGASGASNSRESASTSGVPGGMRGQLLGSTSATAVSARLEAAQLARLQDRGFRDDSVGAMRNPGSSQSAAAVAKAATGAGGGIVQYNPLNPGPLSREVADTFRSGTYSGRTLTQETTLYRVISDNGNPSGSYWTSVKPTGPLQAVSDYALDQKWGNRATRVVTATMPAGTVVYEGYAARQEGLPGGGIQIYVPKVNSDWIKE